MMVAALTRFANAFTAYSQGLMVAASAFSCELQVVKLSQLSWMIPSSLGKE
jgi:hypothetical protein